MGQNFHRIGNVRCFHEPVHVAYRGLQNLACQHHIKQSYLFCKKYHLPADRKSLTGHPNANAAVDHALWRKIDRCFLLSAAYSRCRGPPPHLIFKNRIRRVPDVAAK